MNKRSTSRPLPASEPTSRDSAENQIESRFNNARLTPLRIERSLKYVVAEQDVQMERAEERLAVDASDSRWLLVVQVIGQGNT